MNVYIVEPGVGYEGQTAECLEVRRRLEAALAHAQGEYSVDDLMRMFGEGKLQLWVAIEKGMIEALASTQAVEYGRMSVLRVVTLSGSKMADWIGPLVDGFARYCREQGLARIEAVGRKGFVRALKNLGFKEVYTTVIREVLGV